MTLHRQLAVTDFTYALETTSSCHSSHTDGLVGKVWMEQHPFYPTPRNLCAIPAIPWQAASQARSRTSSVEVVDRSSSPVHRFLSDAGCAQRSRSPVAFGAGPVLHRCVQRYGSPGHIQNFAQRCPSPPTTIQICTRGPSPESRFRSPRPAQPSQPNAVLSSHGGVELSRKSPDMRGFAFRSPRPVARATLDLIASPTLISCSPRVQTGREGNCISQRSGSPQQRFESTTHNHFIPNGRNWYKASLTSMTVKSQEAGATVMNKDGHVVSPTVLKDVVRWESGTCVSSHRNDPDAFKYQCLQMPQRRDVTPSPCPSPPVTLVSPRRTDAPGTCSPIPSARLAEVYGCSRVQASRQVRSPVVTRRAENVAWASMCNGQMSPAVAVETNRFSTSSPSRCSPRLTSVLISPPVATSNCVGSGLLPTCAKPLPLAADVERASASSAMPPALRTAVQTTAAWSTGSATAARQDPQTLEEQQPPDLIPWVPSHNTMPCTEVDKGMPVNLIPETSNTQQLASETLSCDVSSLPTRMSIPVAVDSSLVGQMRALGDSGHTQTSAELCNRQSPVDDFEVGVESCVADQSETCEEQCPRLEDDGTVNSTPMQTTEVKYNDPELDNNQRVESSLMESAGLTSDGDLPSVSVMITPDEKHVLFSPLEACSTEDAQLDDVPWSSPGSATLEPRSTGGSEINGLRETTLEKGVARSPAGSDVNGPAETGFKTDVAALFEETVAAEAKLASEAQAVHFENLPEDGVSSDEEDVSIPKLMRGLVSQWKECQSGRSFGLDLVKSVNTKIGDREAVSTRHSTESRRSRLDSARSMKATRTSMLFNDAMGSVVPANQARHPRRAGVGHALLKGSKPVVRPKLGQARDDSAMVKQLFYDSMPYKHIQIESIELHMQPELLKQFLKKVAAERSSVEATWHGAPAVHIPKILSEGLNTGICQTGAYGMGAYVGTHAGVAHQYADPDSSGLRHMCAVLVVAGSQLVKGNQGEQAKVTASDRVVNPTQYCFVDADRLLVSHLIRYRVLGGAAKRTGGGWKDPFESTLSAAVRRAARNEQKSGKR